MLLPVIRLEDHHRHGFHSRKFAGPKAPLSGDELVSPFGETHRQGLQKPYGTDGIRQLLQGLFIEVLPGLPRVGSNLSERNRKKSVVFPNFPVLRTFPALFGMSFHSSKAFFGGRRSFFERGILIPASSFACEIPHHVHDRPPS
jgi:hypothetical protein